MIEYTLMDDLQQPVVQFDIPQTAAEIRLVQYIDFLVALRKWKEDETNDAAQMGRAVAAFLGVDIVDLAQIKFGRVQEYDQQAMEMVDSLYKIYMVISKVVGEYKPKIRNSEDLRVQYKGVDLVMPGHMKMAAIGIEDLGALSFLEAVETYELKRVTQEVMEKEGDPEGSYLYSQYLGVLALLLRKPGEALPVDDVQRAAFLQQRKVFFKDITLDIALDLDFFLFTGQTRLNKQPNFCTFLTPQTLALLGLTRPNAKPLVKQKNRRKMRQKGLAGAGPM